jgi:hypothetical protein
VARQQQEEGDGRQRLRGWLLYDGVRGWKYLRKLRQNAKPDDKLFLHNHRDEMRKLLEACGCGEEVVTGMLRNARSLRSMGLSLRLMKVPTPPVQRPVAMGTDVPATLMNFYIQCHPDKAVGRIIGFGGDEKDERPRARKSQKLKELPSSERMLNRFRRQIPVDEMKDNDDIYGEDQEIAGDGVSTTTSRPALHLVARKKR